MAINYKRLEFIKKYRSVIIPTVIAAVSFFAGDYYGSSKPEPTVNVWPSSAKHISLVEVPVDIDKDGVEDRKLYQVNGKQDVFYDIVGDFPNFTLYQGKSLSAKRPLDNSIILDPSKPAVPPPAKDAAHPEHACIDDKLNVQIDLEPIAQSKQITGSVSYDYVPLKYIPIKTLIR